MSGFMVDNSVWGRYQRYPSVRLAVDQLDDVIYTCTPQRVEFFYSARCVDDLARLVEFLDRVGVYLKPESGLDDTCMEIQTALAKAGKLRAVGPIDVMIAAYAITNRMTVLHYDSDFDDHLGSAVPELRQQWVVPRGSL